MTPAQHNAISALMTERSPAAREAARLVLVEGMRIVDAAAVVGISQHSAANAVRRYRDRHAMIVSAGPWNTL